MKEPFPFNSLSPKQTVIVSELLRDHPHGHIENDSGKPVFISDPGASAIRIPLTETDHEPGHRDKAGRQQHAD
jgi:hypothetical protein